MANADPVVATMSVHATAADAVRTFTERIGEWWPIAGNTVGEGKVAGIVFEPREGGRLYERWHDGEERDWGRVLTWQPPALLAFAWQPDPGEVPSTEVEVRFDELGPTVTRVRVEHRGWEALGGEADAARASSATRWLAVLAAYEAAASDPESHRAFGRATNLLTWSLLDLTERTPEQDEQMVHAAHASAWHWSIVGDASNATRGEWLIAHVYTVLGQAERAIHHARLALSICEQSGLGDFDLAYAYEGVARAAAAGGDLTTASRYRALAAAAANDIADAEDREIFEADLASEPWFESPSPSQP